MSIRDDLLLVLDDHSLMRWTSEERNSTTCKCGWNGNGFELHRIDAVLARFGVVELPKPMPTDANIAVDMDDPFEFRAPWGTYYATGGLVESDTGPSWTTAHARAEAAALLAAANRAEAQS